MTGMEVANASLLDEATAAAEAMFMCFNIGHKRANKFFVSEAVFPQTLELLKTRSSPLGIELVVGNLEQLEFIKGDCCGVLTQYPDNFGKVESLSALSERVKAAGASLVVGTDLLSLALLKPPGEFGADIVYGNSQRFGVPMGYGGPHAAFFATNTANMRKMPGRIIGVSIDCMGNQAMRMTMQTREQHIRRDRATSNICTAQALLANIAAMYSVYHGPDGLRDIAHRVNKLACITRENLVKLGY